MLYRIKLMCNVSSYPFSKVFNNTVILARDSAYSSLGSESLVIPPPPQQCRLESLASTVLIAMFRSVFLFELN